MGKILARESVLIVLVGLFGGLAVPALLGYPPALGLFLVGLVLGLTFAPLYALSLLGGTRMPAVIWKWIGPFAWVFVFWNDFMTVVQALMWGAALTLRSAYVYLLPGLFGLLLVLLAALRASRGERAKNALWALYLYGLPMVVIRFALVPAVQVNVVLAGLAMQGGALYLFLHGLLRIYVPVGPEAGDDVQRPPLVQKALPDAVVGLAEGTLHRRARPFATLAGGAADESAISFAVRPDEVAEALEKLSAAMENKPVVVEQGQQVGGEIEVIVRRRS
jgi:hypothetical protein